MKGKTKPTQIEGNHSVTELPTRTKVNTLQRKKTESFASTVCHPQYSECDPKLKKKKKTGKCDSKSSKKAIKRNQPQDGLRT